MTKTPNTTPQPNYPDQIIGDKPQPGAEHAVNAAPISADLRGIEGLSEQDAGLLEQAASMLEGLHNDERNRGNCSTAEGAACSADAVRRLAVQLLRAAQPAQEVAEPSPTAGMNLGQRILHVGGRENAAGYIEFGSVAAVRALVGQVLRDLNPAQPARECLQQSAEPQAWLVHIPSSDTQNVYDSQEDCGYIDDLTNNDDAVVTPLYAALQAAPPAPEAVAVPDALVSDARRLAYVADQVRALEVPGSESDVYLTEAAHVLRACADRIAALSAAPAQAVAVPAEVDMPDVEDMAHSAVQEALSHGVSHDVFHRWMRTVMDKTVQAMAAPAQEHATQLAAQGQPTWDELKSLAIKHGGWIDGYGPFAAELLATYGRAPEDQPHWVEKWLIAQRAVHAAAPIQAQEDARDAARYRWLRDPATDVALVLDKRVGYTPISEDGLTGGYGNYEYRAGDELDAAIDAARAAQGGA